MTVIRARCSGFSFVELLATLAIMALLLAVALPVAQKAVQRHREAELREALSAIRTAIDRYHKAAEDGRIRTEPGTSGYPPDLRALVDGVDDIGSPTHRKLYFLRRLPADPFQPGRWRAPEDTWGIRSYSSPPDAPEAGDDVFDVYSLNPGTGLNGVPYREW